MPPVSAGVQQTRPQGSLSALKCGPGKVSHRWHPLASPPACRCTTAVPLSSPDLSNRTPQHNPTCTGRLARAGHVVHVEAKRLLPICQKIIELGKEGIWDHRGKLANVVRKANADVAPVGGAMRVACSGPWHSPVAALGCPCPSMRGRLLLASSRTRSR